MISRMRLLTCAVTVATACSILVAPTEAQAQRRRPAQTFEQRVAKARRDLLSDADKAFNDTWWKEGIAVAETIPAVEQRKLHLWAALGTTYGYCRDYARPAEIADWIALIDTIKVSGPDAPAARAAVRGVGLGVFKDSEPSYLVELGLYPAERKALCAVDLAAADSIVRDLQSGRPLNR